MGVVFIAGAVICSGTCGTCGTCGTSGTCGTVGAALGEILLSFDFLLIKIDFFIFSFLIRSSSETTLSASLSNLDTKDSSEKRHIIKLTQCQESYSLCSYCQTPGQAVCSQMFCQNLEIS